MHLCIENESQVNLKDFYGIYAKDRSKFRLMIGEKTLLLLGAHLSSHCLSIDGSSSKCWSTLTYPERHEPSLDTW